MNARRAAAMVALLKILASAVVLASGFRAVSDDDFARVVIAEQWAHAPRFDASGTSWLPLPFWISGAVLAAFGRSLAVARATAFALGVASAWLVYLAARWIGSDRGSAIAGAGLAAILPWSARLGVCTVPELPTAALTLLAMASLAPPLDEVHGLPRRAGTRRILGGIALLAATLSRYEAWPVAVAFAAACVVVGLRDRGPDLRADLGLTLLVGALALLGPAVWIAWNRHAHGDAFHFLARVAAYRKALGGAEPGALSRLTAYPHAMIREEPELFALLAMTLVAAALERAPGLRARLRRFAWPFGLVLFQVAALSAAMIKDGAPTHHPERALLVATLLAALVAGDAAVSFIRAARPRVRLAAALGAAAAVALVAGLVRPSLPHEGFTPREEEVAVGLAARAIMPAGERALIEVVDYGHLAVVAALGRPEEAVLDRSIDPRDPPARSSFEGVEALAARRAASGARFLVGRVAKAPLELCGEPEARRGSWGVFRAP